MTRTTWSMLIAEIGLVQQEFHRATATPFAPAAWWVPYHVCYPIANGDTAELRLGPESTIAGWRVGEDGTIDRVMPDGDTTAIRHDDLGAVAAEIRSRVLDVENQRRATWGSLMLHAQTARGRLPRLDQAALYSRVIRDPVLHTLEAWMTALGAPYSAARIGALDAECWAGWNKSPASKRHRARNVIRPNTQLTTMTGVPLMARAERRVSDAVELRAERLYRTASSRWAPVKHETDVHVADRASNFDRASATGKNAGTAWSSNGKWSGNNSAFAFVVPLRFLSLMLRGEMVIDGKLVLDAVDRGGKRLAAWVTQGRGFELHMAYGHIVRDAEGRAHLKRSSKVTCADLPIAERHGDARSVS